MVKSRLLHCESSNVIQFSNGSVSEEEIFKLHFAPSWSASYVIIPYKRIDSNHYLGQLLLH